MTTVTLATIESPRHVLLQPVRWQVADLGTPTTAVTGDPLEAVERAHLALTVFRLIVLTLLGTGAMVAGAFIGRL